MPSRTGTAYTVVGAADCVHFARAERLAVLLKTMVNLTSDDVVINMKHPDEWAEFLDSTAAELGFEAYVDGLTAGAGKVLVFNHMTGRLVGSSKTFGQELKKKYGIVCDLGKIHLQAIADENMLLFKNAASTSFHIDGRRQMRKLRLAVVGAAESGSLQEAEALAQRFGLVLVNGGTGSDAEVATAIAARATQEDCQKNGFVVVDFPRTASQLEALTDTLLDVDLIISLVLSEGSLVSRRPADTNEATWTVAVRDYISGNADMLAMSEMPLVEVDAEENAALRTAVIEAANQLFDQPTPAPEWNRFALPPAGEICVVKEDEPEAIVVEAGSSTSSSSVQNGAFVFIKPTANNALVRSLVQKVFEEKGVKIVREGEIKAETIDAENLIDNHYYAIANKATLTEPKDLTLPEGAAEKFKEAFGLEWDQALEAGLVHNAKSAVAVHGEKLQEMWMAASLVKFGGGFYCGKLPGDEPMFVINGFFASMRQQFVAPDTSIYYFDVRFDASTLSWADFRGKVLGPTDPSKAPEESLRGQLYAKWTELELAGQPTTGTNGVHASASPFEGMVERMNWLKTDATADFFATLLVEAGVSLGAIETWKRDPHVEGVGSLFDSMEDLDCSECIAKAHQIYMSSPDAPEVVKVEGGEGGEGAEASEEAKEEAKEEVDNNSTDATTDAPTDTPTTDAPTTDAPTDTPAATDAPADAATDAPATDTST